MTNEPAAQAAPRSKADAQPASAPSGRTVTDDARAFRRLRAIGAKLGEEERFQRILDQLRAASRGTTSVVVVGEVSRGKSTLVNALIGQPGLAPVDAAETTALVVNFVPATVERPAGTAVVEFERQPTEREIPLADLDRWVRVDGDELAASEETPKQAYVSVDSWLLPGTVIVDTPGTGGLSEAYAKRAIDRAERAGILVLVTDASGRISSHALAFLDACAGSVAATVVVVNKIDAHRSTWESVAEETRRILTDAGDRYGRTAVVGVSARWAERAAAEQDETRRNKLIEQSRIMHFVAEVQRLAERANTIPAANALRQAHTVLRPHLERLLTERDALNAAATANGEAQGAAASAAEQALLDAKAKREALLLTFDDTKYDWPALVDEVRADIQADIGARCRRFQATWRARAEGSWSGLNKKSALALQNELDAALEVELTEQITHIVQQCAKLVLDLYDSAGMQPSDELLALFGAKRDAWRGERHEQFERHGGPLDPRALLGSAMMGSGLFQVVVGGAGIATGGVVFGVLAAAGGASFWMLRRKQNVQAMTQVITDRSLELRDQLERFQRRSFSLIQTEARKQFDRDLKQAVADAKAEVQRLQQACAASGEDRAKRLSIIGPQISVLGEALADADRQVHILVHGDEGVSSAPAPRE